MGTEGLNPPREEGWRCREKVVFSRTVDDETTTNSTRIVVQTSLVEDPTRDGDISRWVGVTRNFGPRVELPKEGSSSVRSVPFGHRVDSRRGGGPADLRGCLGVESPNCFRPPSRPCVSDVTSVGGGFHSLRLCVRGHTDSRSRSGMCVSRVPLRPKEVLSFRPSINDPHSPVGSLRGVLLVRLFSLGSSIIHG